MDKGASFLTDRGVVRISGAEALSFLHKLVTNSLLDLKPGDARYAALLSGQGKLLFDFFVFRCLRAACSIVRARKSPISSVSSCYTGCVRR
jgi:tRNA-modifying protein YgfZ